MWKLLLPVVEEVSAQSRRKGGLKADLGVEGDFAAAAYLERMGMSLDIVAKMIRMDEQTKGQPLITSHDRPTAANLLMLLLSDKGQREAYDKFLKLVVPEFRHTALPDDLTCSFIAEQRWSQLSSVYLGKLLLNPTALAHLAKKLLAESPAAWAGLLPPPKAEKASKASKAPKAAGRKKAGKSES